MKKSQIEELFEQLLTSDYEAASAWKAMALLHADGNLYTFRKAQEWICSESSLKRARGVMVLSQLHRKPESGAESGNPKWLFREASFAIVCALLEDEKSLMVISTGISALGHIANPEAASLICRYIDHLDEDVRFASACALGCFPDDR